MGLEGKCVGGSGEARGGADSPLLPLTPRPDAALGLLLGVRVAWSHLLPLSIRKRAPKRTQMFEGRHLEGLFQRDRVRLGRLLRPHYPILCLSPRGPGLPWRALPPRGPSEAFAKPPWRVLRTGNREGALRGDLRPSRDLVGSTEALTCSTAPSGRLCARSRLTWSPGM